jgi:phosphoribosylanthranilate isomerase
MGVDVKICGLNDPAAVAAAVEGGARLVGFVFFPASPRVVTPAKAGELGKAVPPGIIKVGLVVDADDQALADIVKNAKVDLLQLHGHESPERVAEIKVRFGLPVMKVVAVASEADVEAAHAYEGVADRLMFDAKPPKDASRPGGNARAFDWALLKGRIWRKPWILAGGLNAANVAEAVRVSGAKAVDVSSGVEDVPGRKNPKKILEFLRVAATL